MISNITVSGASGNPTPQPGGVLPPVTSVNVDGPFSTTIDTNTGPAGRGSVFRPTTLGANGLKHPVFIWGPGAGATPASYDFHLRRIASHGFVVYSEVSTGNGSEMRAALDFMIAENARAAVAVALPTLDMFLNDSGMAYADGAVLPTRFGTYFWGLGLTPGRWAPKTVGAGWEITPELESLRGLEKKVSVFSGFRVLLDGRPNIQHWSGQGAVLTGRAPASVGRFDLASFDTAVAEQLGSGTRFRSIQLTPFGNPRLSYSTHTGTSFNTPDATPLALYQRLFGEGFQDPNSDNWTPDPKAMLRKSVLSAITEQGGRRLGTVSLQ